MAEGESATVLVQASELKATIAQIFERLGVPSSDAAAEAEILVDADLRGVDTHGALLVPLYIKKFKAGLYNKTPRFKTLKETPSTLVVDGDNGLGHIAAVWTMERCIEKARQSGACFAGLNETNHVGAMAYYAIMAADAGMVGFAVTDTHSNLAPWGSNKPLLGNNPFAVAVPGGEQIGPALDMALSVAAKAKINKAANKGERIPEGWAIDPATGKWITDPEWVVGPPDKRRPFLLAPVGGVKGYGMLVIGTILAGILSGARNYGPHLPAFGSQFTEVQHLGVFMGAIHIEAFMPLDEFKRKVDDLVSIIKAAPRLPGFDEIFLPGEIEWRLKEKRLREGIPMVRKTWTDLQDGLKELNK